MEARARWRYFARLAPYSSASQWLSERPAASDCPAVLSTVDRMPHQTLSAAPNATHMHGIANHDAATRVRLLEARLRPYAFRWLQFTRQQHERRLGAVTRVQAMFRQWKAVRVRWYLTWKRGRLILMLSATGARGATRAVREALEADWIDARRTQGSLCARAAASERARSISWCQSAGAAERTRDAVHATPVHSDGGPYQIL